MHQAVPPPPFEPPPPAQRFLALYDWQSGEPGDLEFRQGDRPAIAGTVIQLAPFPVEPLNLTKLRVKVQLVIVSGSARIAATSLT